MDAFRWRVEKYPVSAQTAGEHLKELESEYGGAITPAIVLDDSRPNEAVLHPCFEWNDSKAAEKYRLSQSQDLIGNLVTVKCYNPEQAKPVVKTITVRAFTNTSPFGERAVYTSTDVAMAEEKARINILRNAKKELEQLRHKWEALIDFDALLREELEKNN